MKRTINYVDGKVYHKKSKILKQNRCYKKDGSYYLAIELNFNGISKRFFIHRLVAQAFIPNPENKPQVNHIDGNKANNCVDNLEWSTQSENEKHAFSKGWNKTNPNKSGATKVSNEVTRKPVKCIETNTIYKSYSDAAKKLGLKYSSYIHRSVHLGVKTHGYTFVLVNKE